MQQNTDDGELIENERKIQLIAGLLLDIHKIFTNIQSLIPHDFFIPNSRIQY